MTRAPGAWALVVLTAVLSARGAGATTAADLCSSTANPCLVTRVIAVTSGSLLDLGNRALELGQGGVLDVGTGTMTIRAASVRLASGTACLGRGGTGGTIRVEVSGAIRVEASGSTRARIDVSGDTLGGRIELVAGGDVVVAGTLIAKGNTTVGNGGGVVVQGATVVTGGEITVAGGAQGQGGSVSITSTGPMTLGGAVDASGGNIGGGGAIVLDSGAGLSSTGRLDVGCRNGSCDAGTLTVTAAGAVALQGQVAGQGLCADTDGCASSGAELTVEAGLGITVSSQVALSGGGPDGLGGGALIEAGGDALLSGQLLVDGKGSEGEAGELLVTAGGNVTLGIVDANGGADGGGTIDVEAGGTVVVPAAGDVGADSRTGGFAGDVDLRGDFVSVAGKVHASGGDDTTTGGFVSLDGCEVTVAAGAQLVTRGVGGTNLVLASNQMTIGGAFVSGLGALGTGGLNELRFRDPTQPPVIEGTATFLPPRVQLADPTLPVCVGPPPPGCGNDVLEGGEQCDDGNTTACDGCASDCRLEQCGDGVMECGELCDDHNLTACDGCSTTCRTETCGNGVVECAEQCDEGPQNGVPGGTCRADCTLPPPPGCGDGTQQEGEQCDDGNTTACDGCSATCHTEVCGNGTVECAEQCDDLNLVACDGCSATCRFEVCGNGVPECTEECDEGPANGMPGAHCDTACRLGVICTESGVSPCIPCARDTDCDPLGRCGGQDCGADGICRSVAPPSCDDGQAATVDRCVLDANEAPVCQHECLGTGACDDGNACNGIETCSAGGCLAGALPDCDDRDPCTDDACTGAEGCVHSGISGVASIVCRLEPGSAALDAVSPLEITGGLERKVRTRLARIRTRLEAAAQAESATVYQLIRSHLRTADLQLRALGQLVARAVRRGRLAPRVGEPLAAAIAGARVSLATVKANVPP